MRDNFLLLFHSARISVQFCFCLLRMTDAIFQSLLLVQIAVRKSIWRCGMVWSNGVMTATPLSSMMLLLLWRLLLFLLLSFSVKFSLLFYELFNQHVIYKAIFISQLINCKLNKFHKLISPESRMEAFPFDEVNTKINNSTIIVA